MGRRINSGNSVIRTERGWGGHFICADRCAFRRNTLLECEEIRVVVSTVGKMIDPITKKIETIGAIYYYETMCFLSEYKKGYWDANVSKQITELNLPWQVNKISIDSDHIANNMHETTVDEITERLKKGIPLKIYNYGE